MVPIEAVAVLLWLAFGLVGLVRKFPVELGASIGLVAMLFMLQLAGDGIGKVAVRLGTISGSDAPDSVVRWLAYSAIILAWVCFMYGGQTLSFAGRWPPNRFVGPFFDVLVGLVNGWIVVGTWWHVTDDLGYPIQHWALYHPPVSSRALELLALTPQAIIPESYATMILGGFLVLLIALRVFR